MKISKAREEECKEALLKYLQPGDTVYTVLRHVSRSGMYRVIDLYIYKDNQPIRLSGYAADLLEGYDTNHNGCKASGCGMDMGFHLVYNLSHQLFPDGFGVEGKSPHNHICRPKDKESAKKAVKAGYNFWGRNGNVSGWDNDGGYALNQRWQ